MTYASAGTVEANDFNNRANTVNAIWGNGAGANGYGQSTTVSTVTGSSTQTIAASQWATLTTRLNSLTNHQSGTGTLATGFYTAGNLITYWANVDTALSNIQTNKLLFNSTRATAIPTALGGPLMSSSGGWTTSNTNEFSVTFTSTDTVRYFFNAGGIITFYLTQAGGVNTKSTDWATFFTNTVGTISFGSNYCSRSGTGGDNLTTNTGVGFHSLTTSYQTLFAIGSTSATSDYGNNYITIEAKVSGALYGASSNIVSFRVISYDAAADVNADLVDGTTALYVGMTPPEVTYLANTWSFPTAAVVANTQNTLSVTPTIDYLIVGGGGGGGNGIYNRASGGGGGGGGVLYGNAVAVSAATQYNISVGGGGAYLATPGNGVQVGATGTNTTLSLGSVIAYGGGGGGSYNQSSLTGGSTGGSASTINPLGGYWPNPTGSGQGYGSGFPVGNSGAASAAAGGGGAGGQGGGASGGTGGAGGAGRSIAITGASVTYAGGGGGGGQVTGGAAGSGGGGAGASYAATGVAGANGSPFFGGGGGGGAGGSSVGPYLSAASGGGSGICVIRYRDIYANATATTGSPTYSLTGGFRIFTWTGVGSITL